MITHMQLHIQIRRKALGISLDQAGDGVAVQGGCVRIMCYGLVSGCVCLCGKCLPMALCE